MVKVVYITSLGHSGSTLLDLLLSSHSGVFSVGEVINVRNYAHALKEKNAKSKYGNECTCEAPTIWECPFWTQVEPVIREQSGLSLKDLDFRAYDHADWGRWNRALYEAVATVSGCNVIVDSSKAPRRLEGLFQIEGLEVLPIHLIRPARAFIYSKIKRNESPVISSLHFTRRTWQIRRTLRGRKYPVCRYERLTNEPETVVRELMAWIGLPFEAQQMDWGGRVRHNLGGNGMRRSKESTIKPDLAFQEALTWSQKLLIDTLTLPTRFMLPKQGVPAPVGG